MVPSGGDSYTVMIKFNRPEELKRYSISEHLNHIRPVLDCKQCRFHYWFSGKELRDSRK
jgi:hypothetical protein